jgi:uracil-DNA glycosylase family 4
MSKEIIDEALAITRDLENQLKFHSEMGFEDIGGSAPAADWSTTQDMPALSVATATLDSAVTPGEAQFRQGQPRVRQDEPADHRTSHTERVDMFGEAVAPRGREPYGLEAISVLESRDPSLEGIRQDIGDCKRCRLHEHRKTIVFGEGDPKAKLVFVGEGPGADEDASGRPFVGRAGQLLDKIIVAIGLRREDVYIANIVKCRPPGNRTPERDEVDTCEPFLMRQLAFIRPEVIVALGSPAFQCLLRTREPITRARGQWRDWNGIKVMPTFHPAFLLRSPDKKREVWEDMKKVRDYLNTKSS